MSDIRVLEEKILRIEKELSRLHRAQNGFFIDGPKNMIGQETQINGILTVSDVARAKDPAADTDLVTRGYANTNYSGTSHTHDTRYYTETESDLRFAPIAKGVTNGDSHDHVGGDGGAITESAITLADNTTNNVSTSKHGFIPKLPNVATQYLGGTGSWTSIVHNLLSTTLHGDAASGTVAAGDLMYGNSTPKWDRLAKGGRGRYLRIGSSLPEWTLDDGWVDCTDLNPEYVSSTSITLEGDVTSRFKRLSRVRYKQTTYKYGVVSTDSTYSAVTEKTTVTFISTSLYSVANASITELNVTFGTPVDWPWGTKRLLSFSTYQALTYNASFASNYQPYNATLPENCLLLDYAIGIYIVTTNDSSNYYTFSLRQSSGSDYTGSALFTTATSSPNTWLRFSGTLNVEALTATDQMIYWYMTKAGSPGNFYLTGGSVSII